MKKSLILAIILLSTLCTSCDKDGNETQSQVTDTSQSQTQETSIAEVSTAEDITTVSESTSLAEESSIVTEDTTTISETTIESQATSNIEYISSDDTIKALITDYIQSMIGCDTEKYLSLVYDTTEDRDDINPLEVLEVMQGDRAVDNLIFETFGVHDDDELTRDNREELYNTLKNDLSIVSIGDYVYLNQLDNYDVKEFNEEYLNKSADDFILCNFTLSYKDQVGEYSILLYSDGSGNWKVANEGDTFYNTNVESIMQSKYYDLF